MCKKKKKEDTILLGRCSLKGKVGGIVQREPTRTDEKTQEWKVKTAESGGKKGPLQTLRFNSLSQVCSNGAEAGLGNDIPPPQGRHPPRLTPDA